MTREECLDKIARRVVPFPETGERLYWLRGLSAQEYTALEAWTKAHPEEKFFALLFVNGVCDENGNRILKNEDAATVADGLGGIVNPVAAKVWEISNIGDDEGKAQSAQTQG